MSPTSLAAPATQERDEARTFQGRKLRRTTWKGVEVEVVEGLLAYRHKQKKELETGFATKVLGAPAVRSGKLNALGIGILDSGESLAEERAFAASEILGPDVLWAEPVMLDYGFATPNDQFFSQQWALKEIQAESAWDLWKGAGEKVTLAILDSGIPLQNKKLSHADLDDAKRFHLGHDFINNHNDPTDDHGHGTHVVGIAAAQVDNQVGVAGLAWNTEVLVIKVFNNSLDGSNEVFMNGVLSAIEYAKKSGKRLIINYSGGGPPGDLKHDTVKQAHDNGALLVAAAGNDHAFSIRHPAAYSTEFDSVIAVGAVNRNRERADFSNRGPEMTVVAPGVDILSTMPDYYVTANAGGKQTKYDRWEGTSMAAPFVAALAALIWSKSPGMTAAEVRRRLTDTADKVTGDTEEVGSGIINARKALE